MPQQLMNQQTASDRVTEILDMLSAGQSRDTIANKFGYSTWKSLDIYMRRHGFTWDSHTQIYSKATPQSTAKESQNCPSMDMVALNSISEDINPEDIVRLFNLGILDARDIAKRVGFTTHKEMAAYMFQQGYVWSPSALNYINSNPVSTKINLEDSTPNSLSGTEEADPVPSMKGNNSLEKYGTLLEFLWKYRDNLVKIIESMNGDKQIKVYHVPGQSKTKSIFLSDALTDLMTALCQKHSLSQKQGYEAALVEYLSKYGYRDRVEELLEVHEDV